MPVHRFRTFDDARRALWLPQGDARIAQRMRHLARMAGPTRPVQRGVSRWLTIQEAKQRKGAAWQVRPDLDGS
jgi:hypothetical protein